MAWVGFGGEVDDLPIDQDGDFFDGGCRFNDPDFIVFVDIEDVLAGDFANEFLAFIDGRTILGGVEVKDFAIFLDSDFLPNLKGGFIDGFILARVGFGGEVDGRAID